jgi:hypothetical protein
MVLARHKGSRRKIGRGIKRRAVENESKDDQPDAQAIHNI